MSTGEHPTLEEIIPTGIFVGTSLILRQGGQFLYGLRPVKEEDGRAVIEITGIGGGLEQEDDTFAAGVRREAQEEMGCDVRLVPCPETLLVRGRDQLEWVRLAGDERPAAVVLRHHRTPPHRPWYEDHAGVGWVIVYLAELAGSPWPSMELPWLIWLSPEQVLATARQDMPLADLLGEGAELVIGTSGPPPEGSWVRLTDSQEALGIALGEELPAFYNSLAAESPLDVQGIDVGVSTAEIVESIQEGRAASDTTRDSTTGSDP